MYKTGSLWRPEVSNNAMELKILVASVLTQDIQWEGEYN